MSEGPIAALPKTNRMGSRVGGLTENLLVGKFQIGYCTESKCAVPCTVRTNPSEGAQLPPILSFHM